MNIGEVVLIIKYTYKKELTKGTIGSAGIDLYCEETKLIFPFCYKAISLGAAFELPSGTFGFLTSRSSTIGRTGLNVVNGVIDSDYRGAIKAVFFNATLLPRLIKKGDRLVQLIPVKHENNCKLIKVNKLSETERGNKGFGSTGGD